MTEERPSGPGAPKSHAPSRDDRAALIVFARAPIPGKVKTRLVPPLDAPTAALVYEACLTDVLARASAVAAELRIHFDDPTADGYFAARYPHVPRHAQPSGDLGQRMRDAFDGAFREGFDRVVIIGSDAPTLPVEHLSEGLERLRQADVTLGPAEDGGYYLIGLRAAAWPAAGALFARIPWSTGEVLAETLSGARRVGLRVHLLPRWYDIDRREDLERARKDARGGRLAEVLRSLDLR